MASARLSHRRSLPLSVRRKSFDHGRDLAAWLGLVSEADATGGQAEAAQESASAATSNQRKQLIHGARAALPTISPSVTRRSADGAERADAQDPSQCRDRRFGQQAGESRLERYYGAGNRLTPKRYPWPRRGSLGRSESAGRASGVCERVTTRWPDSQTALRKPGVESGARRRRVL